MTNRAGRFVISLDFELHWGVRDHLRVDQYRDNLLGVRRAIPAILDLFRRYETHATWATVGMLFARDKRALMDALPARRPRYDDPSLSPYDALDAEVGEDESSDPFHFAPSLIRQIADTPHQELGTHTFSHYYCLERGQSAEDFEADLRAALAISAPYPDACRSIVFPRNQLNPEYLPVLARCGITAMRGNAPHWAYAARPHADETPARRAARLADAYLPLISGTRSISPSSEGPTDVPASAFLRPYNPRMRAAEPLRLARIEAAMTRAARAGGLFHLWWHPHNFGVNLRENLANLARLLEHGRTLRRAHDFESATMAEAAA
jgi:peptidoglycan/xylan/chitin deacetylase (PgdA/CDA1 family)